VQYSPEQHAIAINKTQSFEPVPQAVWDFHIGGYQVLDKYLKSRKGRVLTLDEINHVSSIAGSLAFTIAQMARIDDAYGPLFLTGDTSPQSSRRPVHWCIIRIIRLFRAVDSWPAPVNRTCS
jgi:hypothetical protein